MCALEVHPSFSVPYSSSSFSCFHRNCRFQYHNFSALFNKPYWLLLEGPEGDVFSCAICHAPGRKLNYLNKLRIYDSSTVVIPFFRGNQLGFLDLYRSVNSAAAAQPEFIWVQKRPVPLVSVKRPPLTGRGVFADWQTSSFYTCWLNSPFSGSSLPVASHFCVCYCGGQESGEWWWRWQGMRLLHHTKYENGVLLQISSRKPNNSSANREQKEMVLAAPVFLDEKFFLCFEVPFLTWSHVQNLCQKNGLQVERIKKKRTTQRPCWCSQSIRFHLMMVERHKGIFLPTDMFLQAPGLCWSSVF